MKAMIRLAAVAAVLLVPGAPSPLAAQGGTPERLFYLIDARESYESFVRNVAQIDVVGPQSYSVNTEGVLTGAVDPRVLRLAKERGVKVMPLIVNPGWNRELFHQVLASDAARARMIGQMVALGKQHGYWGWQFDFEHIHVADRDALTRFYRETAAALHGAGMTLSIAVMPDPGDLVGATAFHGWFWEYLSGAYDLKALADAGDFISFMTYVQHTSRTPPGPIAGIPWMERTIRHALAQGVPVSKISLGIPFFSHHWFTGFDAERKGFPNARGIGWADARSLVERHGAELLWDDRQKTYFAIWENAGTFEHLWLEDARSLDAKLVLVGAHRLRGISVWRLGQEDPDNWGVVARRLGGRR